MEGCAGRRYAVNDAIVMWLFAVVALELKHRAPKAHTMLVRTSQALRLEVHKPLALCLQALALSPNSVMVCKLAPKAGSKLMPSAQLTLLETSHGVQLEQLARGCWFATRCLQLPAADAWNQTPVLLPELMGRTWGCGAGNCGDSLGDGCALRAPLLINLSPGSCRACISKIMNCACDASTVVVVTGECGVSAQ